MRSNSRVGAYAYANPIVARHAPSSVTPSSGSAQAFSYDANGNMLSGPVGKVMSYDGENRPLGVAFAGKMTCYIYGADGTRLKKVEGLTPAANCPTSFAGLSTTAYFGPVEIRNFGTGAGEQVVTYPQPAVRLVNGVASYLHRDALGSIRAVTNASGAVTERAIYRPYGEQSEWVLDPTAAPESKGFLGERYDADAGLQYLNARYYDPRLGLFIQPDWFEVMKAGVGTNRYSYSFNDPVNKIDPGGNAFTTDVKDEEKWADKDVKTELRIDRPVCGTKTCRASISVWSDGKIIASHLGSPVPNSPVIAINNRELEAFAQLSPYAAALAVVGGYSNGSLTLGQAISLGVSGKVDPGIIETGAPPRTLGNVWSTTKKRTAMENAEEHWNDHGSEFPGLKTQKEYVDAAHNFVRNPGKGTQSFVRKNGETMYYDPSTNTFAVVNPDGAPKTMFKPVTGGSYWTNELEKWR